MNKVTHALAAATGCVVGYMAMAVMYSQIFFRMCENMSESGGFECSSCGSHTSYHPITPFNFCPMCGAFVKRESRI